MKRQGSARLAGLVFAGVGVGIAAAGLLCLAAASYGARALQMWTVLGAAAIIATLAVAPFMGSREAAPKVAGNIAAPMLIDGAAIRMVLCYGALGLGYIIPATFLPAMARQVGHTETVFGWVWPIFGLAAAASTLLAVRRSPWWTNQRTWIMANGVMAVGVSLPVFLPTLTGIAAAGVMVGGTFMVITMVALQEAREVAGAAASRLIAAMTASFALGQIAGPMAANALMAATGSMTTALLAASAVLLASSVGLAIRNQPTEKT